MQKPTISLCAALLIFTACGQNSPPPEASLHAVVTPLAMQECEGDQCAKGQAAVWAFHGTQGEARWSYGAVASLTAERFDAQEVIIHRTDPPGSSSAGLTAVYTGTPRGNLIDGTVTWVWPGHHGPIQGAWHAMIPQSLADQQALIDAQLQQRQAEPAAPSQQMQAAQALMLMGLAGAMLSADPQPADAQQQEYDRIERNEDRARRLIYKEDNDIPGPSF